jgi:Mg2+-importing ATPase
MLIFGPLSSMFDLATFAVLWWVFGAHSSPTVFQTGWFIEGVLTQLLAVLVLRAKVAPWRGARCSPAVVLTTSAVAAIGLLIPVTPLARGLSMTPPPGWYVLWLMLVGGGYAMALQRMKRVYLRQYRDWL